jgi:hypothetical protein
MRSAVPKAQFDVTAINWSSLDDVFGASVCQGVDHRLTSVL